MVSDSYENPDLLLPDIVLLVSDFMKDKTEYHGSPSELANLISRKENKISERKISKLLFTHRELLLQKEIHCEYKRSNGSRALCLYANRDDSADGDDENGSGAAVQNIVPVDPIGTGPACKPPVCPV